jgi:hypothetical protein
MMRTTLRSTLSAVVLALLILAGVTLYIQNSSFNRTSSQTTSQQFRSTNITSQQSSNIFTTFTSRGYSTSSGGTSALSLATLSIRLTDPPTVPSGTKSLNLTYNSLQILVGVINGSLITVKNMFVNTSGTVNLLSIQNVSKTIAVAKIPNGSLIYSIDFSVKSVSININGTVYPVQPVLSDNTLKVVFYPPATVNGDSVALVQISPVVVKTPSGYQMIPSAVAIVRHENVEKDEVGSIHELNQTEESQLNESKAQLTARIVDISISGNETKFTVLVNNTGKVPSTLFAISLHGNFNVSCAQNTEEHDHKEGSKCEHPDTVYFRVVNATSSSGCSKASLKLVGEEDSDNNGTQLNPGQCIMLSFSGVISMGESGNVILPSLAQGSELEVHVIASNGGELVTVCTMPLTSQSCSVRTDGESD